MDPARKRSGTSQLFKMYVVPAERLVEMIEIKAGNPAVSGVRKM